MKKRLQTELTDQQKVAFLNNARNRRFGRTCKALAKQEIYFRAWVANASVLSQDEGMKASRPREIAPNAELFVEQTCRLSGVLSWFVD